MKIITAIDISGSGFALLPALIFVVMLALLSGPLIDLSAQLSARHTVRHQSTLMSRQTQELFELALYQLKAEDGLPEGLSQTFDTHSTSLADACQRRAAIIAPELFTEIALDDGSFSFTPLNSRPANRQQTAFFRALTAPEGYRRFVIVVCTIARNQSSDAITELNGLMAELVESQGSWQLAIRKSL